MKTNPYEPVPMRIARKIVETDDQVLRSFELMFECDGPASSASSLSLVREKPPLG